MTDKRARTRKEMFDALSPEEQEEALKEMAYPYPLMEAVDADVAEAEMDRRDPPKMSMGNFHGRLKRRKAMEDSPQQKELLVKVSRQDALRMLIDLMEGGELMEMTKKRPRASSDDFESVKQPSGKPGAVMSKAPSMKELVKMLKSIEDDEDDE